MKPVLTNDQVLDLRDDWHCFFEDAPGSAGLCIRAIEQAVLQSAAIQALREDAARYREVRRMSLREFSDIYEANIKTGAPFDRLVDAGIVARKGRP